MNILIIYMSSHGCAQNVGSIIAEKLDGYNVTLHNLKEKMLPHLARYEAVIVGGSIHAGEVQSKIKSYCERNQDILEKKILGLYLCCMEKGEVAKKQFEKAYPEKLRRVAVAKALTGGEFSFDKMSFFEKTIVKKMANVSDSISEIKYNVIDDFVDKYVAALEYSKK